MNIEIDQYGYEQTFVENADVKMLAQFIDPKIPYVWILGHMPNPVVQWWESTVPVDKNSFINAKVRDIQYDLQIQTEEFLKNIDAFNEFGIVLIQSNSPMPDTLELSRIPEQHQNSVLAKNGAVLRIFLPHAIETACVTGIVKGHLEKMSC